MPFPRGGVQAMSQRRREEVTTALSRPHNAVHGKACHGGAMAAVGERCGNIAEAAHFKGHARCFRRFFELNLHRENEHLITLRTTHLNMELNIAEKDIDIMAAEAVDLLKRLISTPSVSRDEQKAADIMEAFMRSKGIETRRHGNNVWALCPDFDESRPTLLLNSHIDTVKPVAGWTRDPFTPVEEGDTLYGLGSNDDGGGLVALLQVYMLLAQRERRYNLIYLASCEEEVSGKNGIESVLPMLPRVDLAIVGEPTGLQPAVAEKGLMVLDVTAYGKAGHAARNEGDNAIYKVLDDIRWFETYRFPEYTDLLGPVKTTVTVINAGTQHNVIPDKCVFTVDVRSNECYSNEEIFDTICSHIKCEAKARSFRLNSSRIDLQHPVVRRCIELGLRPFGSPTLSDQALMRFPSMKLGPGESSRSHTADEYILKSEIRAGIKLYLDVVPYAFG